jgi:tRNA pseudouridine38-40 synthase
VCLNPEVATYKLVVEYEGTRYRGWQVQENARSVAGELHRALAEAGQPAGELGGSGRTDAGVHALAQVAHLRLSRPIDPEALRRALNDRLPPDIHVLALEPAHRRFHARHDAVSRSYLYQLSRRRTAFAKRFVWWLGRPLDLAAMARAAELCAGRHDFALFAHRPQDHPSTLVEVERVELVEAGALVLVRMEASHFLWRMVRRVVGALVRVGTGEISSGELTELLAGRLPPGLEELPGAWTAPPSGLFLERVRYAGDADLPPPAPVVPVPWERP